MDDCIYGWLVRGTKSVCREAVLVSSERDTGHFCMIVGGHYLSLVFPNQVIFEALWHVLRLCSR